MRLFVCLILAFAWCAATSEAFAQIPTHHGEPPPRWKVDWHRNNFWPRPFTQADRAAVREPFNIMATNGWRMQNTVGESFFDRESNQLTTAGEHKVKWIVTRAPLSRRTVYVMLGESEDQTATRVDAVQRAVAKYVSHGALPEVFLTDREPAGVPGEYLDATDVAYRNTIPRPRLPELKGGGTNGSSNSGSGGSGGSGR